MARHPLYISDDSTREDIAVALVLCGALDIDDRGRVWRVAVRRSGFLVPLPTPRRIDRPDSLGYHYFRIRGKARDLNVSAHRAAWVYFNGPIPDGLEVNHKDGVKANNRPANLELMTGSENLLHASRVLGTLRGQVGEESPSAVLTWSKVREMRRLHAEGASQAYLAKRFRTSQPNVSNILAGKRWPEPRVR